MSNLEEALTRWQVDTGQVRERMYRAPTPRERERWHAVWLLARGGSAADVTDALARDPHTIGDWLARFCRDGPAALALAHSGGSPRPDRRPAGRPQGGGAGTTRRGRY